VRRSITVCDRDRAMLESGYQIVADRFAVLERIGSGGEGVVYRARDLSSDRDVALKLIYNDSPIARHLNEAALLRDLTHPFIVGYVAHGVSDGRSYVATEWLPGETLASRLARGPLDPATALRCVHGVATALACIHDRGLVHRDVKPSNILLRERDPTRPTVLDFGISLPPVANGLRDVSARGTPSYVAPEQATGRIDIAAAADLFALGCVLYACLTGAPPFEGDTAIAVLSKIVLAPAPRLAPLPSEFPGLDALVQRLLAKPPAGRPRDGRAALELIDAVLRGDRLARPATDAPCDSVEATLLSVVAMSTSNLDDASGHADTAPMVRVDPTVLTGPIVSEVARLGGRALEMPGLALVIVAGSGGVRRNAERAARCALRLQKEWRGARIGIATASGVIALKWPVGPVIEDVLALLAATEDAVPGIYVDAATATFVAGAFEVDEGDGHRSLRAERAPLNHRTPALVGRDPELDAVVRHALQAPDGAAFALVTGPPGIGKSRLAEEVMSRLRVTTPTIRVWSCLCDPMRIGSSLGVVGALLRSALELAGDVNYPRARARASERLAELGEPSAASLGPVLACLAAVPSPHEAPPAAMAGPAGFERDLRRAWVRWLEAEACRGPVVLLIDDFQWTDPATLAFLNVLDQISVGRILLLGFARPDLRDRYRIRIPATPRGMEVVLRSLDGAACRALAADVLSDDAIPLRTERIERVCAQAGGNPLALIELARQADRARTSGDELELVPLMLARLELLALEQQRILRAASVFGEHFPLDWIQHATAQDGTSTASRAAIDALRTLGILDIGRDDQYQFRHRTIRDAAYSLLRGEDRVALHAVAAAWVEKAGFDPIVIAEHWVAAREPGRAATSYLRAAERALADQGMTFRRAAELFDEALLGKALDAADRGRYLRDRAYALACAGIGVEAANAYLAAANHGGADELDLRRRAAEQLLRSGHIDDGMALLKGVMAAVEIEYPATQRAALTQLVRERVRLRLCGMRFHARLRDAIDPRDQLAIDVCHSVGGALAFANPVRALSLMARASRLALASGDRRRAARTLLYYAGMTSPVDIVHAERTYERGRTIAASMSDPELDLLTKGIPGVIEFSAGRFRAAADRTDRFDEARIRSGVAGLAWETVTGRFINLQSRVMLGDIAEVERRLPPLLHDAVSRGDHHAFSVFSTGIMGVFWLCKDQPDETRRRAVAALRDWPTDQFLYVHWGHLLAVGSADLYEGDAQRAYERVAEAWPAAVASQTLRARSYANYLIDLRARTCIARGTPDALREARSWSARTRRIGRHLVWARGLAALHDAALLQARGRRDAAGAAWTEAAARCAASDLRAHELAARCRVAELSGDVVARADALDALRALGVVAPERFVALLAPTAGA